MQHRPELCLPLMGTTSVITVNCRMIDTHVRVCLCVCGHRIMRPGFDHENLTRAGGGMYDQSASQYFSRKRHSSVLSLYIYIYIYIWTQMHVFLYYVPLAVFRSLHIRMQMTANKMATSITTPITMPIMIGMLLLAFAAKHVTIQILNNT